MQVLAWFHSKMDLFYPLIELTKKKYRNSDDVTDDEDTDDESECGSLYQSEEVLFWLT